MLIIALFLINAAMNFALSLVLAKYLGPENFGRYAIAFSAAVVVNSTLLDWVRLCATRFYSDTSRLNAPEVRVTLDLLQVLMWLLIVIISGVLIISGMELGLPTLLVVMISLTAIATGAYDYYTALARARFLDAAYARLILIKNIISFVMMALGAWVYQSPALVLGGYVISMVVAVMSVYRILKDPILKDPAQSVSLFDRPLARRFLYYGGNLVIANGIYQMIPFINRSMVGVQFGLAEAGFFALASDVGFRLFGAIGSSVDIFLFQHAVKKELDHGIKAAQAQIASNLLIVLMLILAATLGYSMVLPFFADVFVPDAFKTAFVTYGTVLAPSLFFMCLIQYGFNPVFQLAHHTWIVSIAAACGLGVNAIWVCFFPLTMGSHIFAYIQTVSMAVAALVCGLFAYRKAQVWPSLNDVLLTGLAGVLMVACLWPLRVSGLSSPLILAIMIPTGVLVFITASYLFNVGQTRFFVQTIWQSIRRLKRG
jgi:O-antigen/teichoic acid export membrane protein